MLHENSNIRHEVAMIALLQIAYHFIPAWRSGYSDASFTFSLRWTAVRFLIFVYVYMHECSSPQTYRSNVLNLRKRKHASLCEKSELEARKQSSQKGKMDVHNMKENDVMCLFPASPYLNSNTSGIHHSVSSISASVTVFCRSVSRNFLCLNLCLDSQALHPKYRMFLHDIFFLQLKLSIHDSTIECWATFSPSLSTRLRLVRRKSFVSCSLVARRKDLLPPIEISGLHPETTLCVCVYSSLFSQTQEIASTRMPSPHTHHHHHRHHPLRPVHVSWEKCQRLPVTSSHLLIQVSEGMNTHET